MRQDGVLVRPLRNIAGTDEFCEVFLDGARVPVANVVGKAGNGWSIAMYALAQERSVGLAQRSLKLSGEFRQLAEIFLHVKDEMASAWAAIQDIIKEELEARRRSPQDDMLNPCLSVRERV